jgi:hypothetical protein
MDIPVRRCAPNCLPIDGHHPTILGLIEMHHPVRQELVALAIVRGIIGVQRQDHPLAKLKRLSFQVRARAGAGQAQAAFIVEVLEFGVCAWVSHEVLASSTTTIFYFATAGRRKEKRRVSPVSVAKPGGASRSTRRLPSRQAFLTGLWKASRWRSDRGGAKSCAVRERQRK